MRHLVFADFTNEAGFHVARISSASLRRSELHDHDFYELVYVHQGGARHVLTDRNYVMQSGELVFVRPQDIHTVTAKPGEQCLFTNVAFGAGEWHAFCALSGLNPVDPWTDKASHPPSLILPEKLMPHCAAAFDRILDSYIDFPSRLDLCAFWSLVMSLVAGSLAEKDSEPEGIPDWLNQACRSMRSPDNLAIGVPQFVKLAGVCAAHLSRCLRRYLGITPTEYVNNLRIRRAAALLITSPAEIVDIALDCGYENLSYFYGQFQKRLGTTPRAYRLNQRKKIVP